MGGTGPGGPTHPAGKTQVTAMSGVRDPSPISPEGGWQGPPEPPNEKRHFPSRGLWCQVRMSNVTLRNQANSRHTGKALGLELRRPQPGPSLFRHFVRVTLECPQLRQHGNNQHEWPGPGNVQPSETRAEEGPSLGMKRGATANTARPAGPGAGGRGGAESPEHSGPIQDRPLCPTRPTGTTGRCGFPFASSTLWRLHVHCSPTPSHPATHCSGEASVPSGEPGHGLEAAGPPTPKLQHVVTLRIPQRVQGVRETTCTAQTPP